MTGLCDIDRDELEQVQGGLIPLVVAVGAAGFAFGVGFMLGYKWGEITGDEGDAT